MRKIISIFCFVLMLGTLGARADNNGNSPFDHYQSDIAIDNYLFRSTQLNISEEKEATGNYVDLRIIEPKMIKTQEERCGRPVMIFLGGFLPGVGRAGYETLLTKLAQRNITVIFPKYLPKSDASKMLYMVSGYSSEKLAKSVQKTIRQYIQDQFRTCKNQEPTIVVYAHSFGTRIAARMADQKILKIDGMILDGVTPENDDGKIADKTNLCMDRSSKNIQFWKFPLSILHYDGDEHMKASTNRAYSQCQADSKQYFEIRAGTYSKNEIVDGKKQVHQYFYADHFSSFSDSKEDQIKFRSEAEKIHGYPIRLGWDDIDENVSLPLLTSLAWAAVDEERICDGPQAWSKSGDTKNNVSDCDFSKKVRAWAISELYQEQRTRTWAGSKIRQVYSSNLMTEKK